MLLLYYKHSCTCNHLQIQAISLKPRHEIRKQITSFRRRNTAGLLFSNNNKNDYEYQIKSNKAHTKREKLLKPEKSCLSTMFLALVQCQVSIYSIHTHTHTHTHTREIKSHPAKLWEWVSVCVCVCVCPASEEKRMLCKQGFILLPGNLTPGLLRHSTHTHTHTHTHTRRANTHSRAESNTLSWLSLMPILITLSVFPLVSFLFFRRNTFDVN